MHHIAKYDFLGLPSLLLRNPELLAARVQLVVASVELLALKSGEALRCLHQVTTDQVGRAVRRYRLLCIISIIFVLLILLLTFSCLSSFALLWGIVVLV